MSGEDANRAYSDLITALLLIFIIILVSYVINFTANQRRSPDLAEQTARIEATRSHIVREVSDHLTRGGIAHKALPDQGLIRMTADTLAFPSSSYRLSGEQQKRMRRLADALARVLPCYAASGTGDLAQRLDCPPDARGQLQSVAIEGHTDNVPLEAQEGMRHNVDLAADRAGTVYTLLTDHTTLKALRNKQGHPLFAIAGYGANRPVVAYDRPTPELRNRRIDLRFILDSPWLHPVGSFPS